MEENYKLDLIAKYLTDNISSEERRVLLAWVNEREENKVYFDEMIKLWSLPMEEEEEDIDTEEAWNKLETRLFEKPQPERLKMRSRKKLVVILASAAAILALIMGGYFAFQPFFPPLEAELVVATDTPKTHKLLDETKVTLNKNSQLTYKDSAGYRMVYLRGEAFFDVIENEVNPFIVDIGTARVTVKGTSFNVRAYPDEEKVDVLVKSGEVEFSNKKNEAIRQTLKANEAATFDRVGGSIALKEMKSENLIAWKTGTLKFENTPIEKVLSDLEKLYDAEFVVEDAQLLSCPFKSTYTVFPDLETVLKDFDVVGLTAERQGDKYIVKGNCSGGN